MRPEMPAGQGLPMSGTPGAQPLLCRGRSGRAPSTGRRGRQSPEHRSRASSPGPLAKAFRALGLPEAEPGLPISWHLVRKRSCQNHNQISVPGRAADIVSAALYATWDLVFRPVDTALPSSFHQPSGAKLT